MSNSKHDLQVAFLEHHLFSLRAIFVSLETSWPHCQQGFFTSLDPALDKGSQAEPEVHYAEV